MASSRCETPNTMHVLAAGNSDYRSESPNNRPISRHSVGSRAGVVDSGSPRRTPTPSKQVSLTSVRRKEDLVSATDEKIGTSSTEAPKRVNGFYRDVQAVSSRLNQKDTNTSTDPLAKASDTHNCESHNSLNGEISQDRLSADESDSSSEDEKVTTAPSELLMEFLDCVMDEDYENAQKLCKMILLYEPDNPEALKFQPLIEAKLLQEEEGSGDNGSGDESEDDDDDDDESDDATDDDDSSEESSDQSESDDSSNIQSQQP